jgi:ABC-type amino acid transport substrate-binding protein
MRSISVLFAVAVAVMQSGCSTASPIRVATDAVFPPFHYVDESGSLAGFDIELARQVVERAGMQVRFERAESYAALFDGLQHGRYDVIAATTGITPDRLKRYGFSRPYFVTCLAVLVRAGPGEPRTPADLKGRRVAASAGTTSASAAHQIERATVVETTRWRDSLAALRAGDVDAVIIDEFEAVPFARDADDLDVLPIPAAMESYGLVLRRDDDELRHKLDAAIDAMEADGTLAELRARFDLDRPPDWPVKPARSH